jgi:hypothetical protein
MVIIEVELPDDLALALAQFLKRVGYNDYRKLAVDQQQAYEMVDAGEKVHAALADKGYAPR